MTKYLLISIFLGFILSLEMKAQEIPEMEVWWQSEIAPTGGGGISYLPNFKDGHGALAITRPSGDETWLLRFPGDTVSVFTWASKSAFNIQTGDFNGDGIIDYIDGWSNIYPGIENGQPPSKQFIDYSKVLTVQDGSRRTIADFNKDGFDDVLINSLSSRFVKILLGGNDIQQFHSIEMSVTKLSEYYSENLIGIYQGEDGIWRVISYWDDYMANPKSNYGKTGFVIYHMNITKESDSSRIVLKEINRTKEDNNGKMIYNPYQCVFGQSSEETTPLLFAVAGDWHLLHLQYTVVFDLTNDVISKSKTFPVGLIGWFLDGSINGDKYKDLIIHGSYNFVDYKLSISHGEIDTVPELRITSCMPAAYSFRVINDVNHDGFNDIALFNDGYFGTPSCFSVVLGKELTTVGINNPESKLSPQKPFVADKNIIFPVDLKQSAQLCISLFSIEGDYICNLLNEYLAAGTHNLFLNIHQHDLPSGTYFLKIESGGQSVTEKIIIAR